MTLGPDRLELIIFDITGKKIDNHPCRLIIEFCLLSVAKLILGECAKKLEFRAKSFVHVCVCI